MFPILTLLKSKYLWFGLAALTIYLLVKGVFGVYENLRDKVTLQAATIASSETLREQCNVNIRQQNAEIDLHAAISEVEQMEREQLMEQINVHRRSRISRTQEVRTETQVALSGLDCPGVALPLDVIRLSNNTRSAANQHSTD